MATAEKKKQTITQIVRKPVKQSNDKHKRRNIHGLESQKSALN